MSRCSSTPSVLDVVLDGDDLTARERAHVAGCGDCAREVARARRFDTELRSVGIDLTPVPLPDARDLVDQRAMSNGGSGMHARRIVAGFGAVVILVAALVGVGSAARSLLVGGADPSFGAAPSVTSGTDVSRANAEDDARQATVAAAERQVAEFLRRSGERVLVGARWNALRADVCGETVAVTVEVIDPESQLVWISGRLGAEMVTSGEAGAIQAAAMAAEKSAAGVTCVPVMSAAPVDELMAAVDARAGVPADSTLIGAELLSPTVAVAVVEGFPPFGERQRWMGVLGRGPDGWTTEPSRWIGMNIPADDGLTPYELDEMGLHLDAAVLVGTIPAPGVEVELVIADMSYRYGVDQEHHGLVIVAPPTFAGHAAFEVLDSAGRTIASGTIGRARP